MRWWERWQVGLAAYGDALQAGGDVVGSLFDEDDHTVGHYMGLLGRAGKGAFFGTANIGMGTMGVLPETALEASDLALDAVHQVASTYQTAVNLSHSPSWLKEQGFSTYTDFQGNVRSYEAMFDADTWSKAWDEAKNTSIGQSYWRGFKWDGQQVDVLDRDAVAKLQDDPMFNVASGLTDALVSWYADPTEKAAKVYTAARKVSNVYQAGSSLRDPWLERMLFKHTRLGQKKTDPWDLAHDSDEVNEFLSWASGRSAREILHHPIVQSSSRKDDFAGVIAGLLDRQDKATAKLVIASAYGSARAFERLQSINTNLAGRIANVREASNLLLESELLHRKNFNLFVGHRDSIIEQKLDKLDPSHKNYFEKMRRLLLEHDQNQKDIFNAIVGEREGASGLLYSATDQVPKMSHTRIADRHLAYESGDFKEFLNSANYPQAVQHLIQPKAFGIPMRVISYFPFKAAQGFTNKRPPSWIDPNRSDSSAGLVAYMKHSKVFKPNEIHMFQSDYLEALDTKARRKIVNQIEGEAVKRIAKRHGIDDKHAKLLATAAQGKRNNAIMQLKNGGKGQGYFMDSDGNIVRWPLFETQEVNSFPLLDLQEFNRTMGVNSDGLISSMYYGTASFIDNAYTSFNGIWSAAQLLRIGYGIRNVTEGGLRLAATLGGSWIALAANDAYKAGIGANAATRIGNVGTRLKTGGKVLGDALQFPIDAATKKILGGAPSTKVIGGAWSPTIASMKDLKERTLRNVDQMGRDLGSVRTQSALGFTYRGHSHESPYFGQAEGYQVLNGASFQNIASARDDYLKILRNTFDANEKIDPTDRGHLEAWTHVAKNVIGKSEIAKKFVEGWTHDRVARWLRRDPYGQNILRKVGGKKRDADEIAAQAMYVVDTYIPLVRGADPMALRTKALSGELTAKDLQDWFPNELTRPQIWNPSIDLNLRTGDGYRALEYLTSRAFKYIAQMPEDKLLRNPAFRQMYIGNVRRLHNNLARQNMNWNITNKDIERIDHAAREKTLRQMKRIMYDGDTKSNIAHRFRFTMGFMSAWEDSITKWGRIIMENPSSLIQGMKLWNAPNEMSLGSTWDPEVFDEKTGTRGAFVPRFQVVQEKKDKDGNGTGEFVKAPVNFDLFSMNDEAKIVMRLPQGIANLIPGARNDVWAVDKGSTNLVAQGDKWWLPSAGPLTQIALSEFLYAHPTKLRDVYKWALPYGPVTREGVMKALMPATYKRLYESGESITDSSYSYSYFNELQTQTMLIKMGKRNAPPTYEKFLKEIKDRTDKFYYLRAAVNFILPFSAENVSPFQYYIDKYRELRTMYGNKVDGNGEPVNVDEMFAQRYGDDFYMFSASLSKNNTGMPATARAWELSEQNRDLIAKDPEMARIYLADVDDGTFDQNVYAAQYRQRFGEGTGMPGREKRAPADALKENNKKLGWLQYTRVMDYIDGLEDEPGADLDFLDFFRKFAGQYIAAQNADFREDFLKSDPDKIPQRIVKMEQLVQDKSIHGREEIRQLQRYLIARKEFMDELDAREALGGAKTLKAEGNRDLKEKWKARQLELAKGNTLFGRIFWRYLSSDQLQRSPLEGFDVVG